MRSAAALLTVAVVALAAAAAAVEVAPNAAAPHPVALGGAAVQAAIPPEDFPAVATRAGLSAEQLRGLLSESGGSGGERDLGYDPAARALVYACRGLGGDDHGHGAGPDLLAAGAGVDVNAGASLQPAQGGEAAVAADEAAAADKGARRAAIRRRVTPGPVDLNATVAPRAATAGSAMPGGGDPGDRSLAFKLHSRPGAPTRILLDFDGHVTTGTAWNAPWRRTITTPPYTIDDSPAFSDQELTNIIAIWRSVAEDFSPWDVDVTTEDDGLSLRGWGMRVAIGGTSCDLLGWCGSNSVRGVAYLNSFGNPSQAPCFVFSDNTLTINTTYGKGFPKYISDIASHELGHTFGLVHDGLTGQAEYYLGHGDWAPIMGKGFLRQVVQWSKGEYPGANHKQDDLALIARYLPPRPDDHGGDAASATPLAWSGTGGAPLGAGFPANASAVGTIGSSGDSDWFTFDAAAGPAAFEVDVTPDSAVPGVPWTYTRCNVDLRLEVYGPSPGAGQPGPRLASFDPQGALLAGAFAANLPANGTYYVALTGVGDTDPPTPGYTDYGSLGQYRLTASFAALAANATSSGGGGGGAGAPKATRVKFVSGSGQRDALGRVRVVGATLLVTDAAGAPLPGAAVRLQWLNPAPSNAAAFAAATKSARTGPAGTLATTSPYAPEAGPIALRVLSVAAPARSNGGPWDREGSDSYVTFSWA